jgi:benzil reductase ((S)-benzoin forming)
LNGRAWDAGSDRYGRLAGTWRSACRDAPRGGFAVLGIGRTASAKLKGKLYQFATCDLARPTLIAAAVTPALRKLAALRPEAVTLINNAAVPTPTGLVGHLDAAEIETALTTNAASAVVMTDLFCRTFSADTIERRIVNISSGAAQTAIAGSAVYSMSKAALEMLTRAIASEHNEPRFHCISVRPGIFETGMQAYMRSRDPAEFPSVAMFRGFKGKRPAQGSGGRCGKDRRQARPRAGRERTHLQSHRLLARRLERDAYPPRIRTRTWKSRSAPAAPASHIRQ